jgi:hypothetical protein
MPRHSHIAAFTGALLLAGTTSAVRGQVISHVDASGRVVVRHCQPAKWPKELPMIDETLDSTAVAALHNALAGHDTAGIVLSIVYRRSGDATVHAVESEGSGGAIDPTLLAVVGRGVLPLDAPNPLGAIRIHARSEPARSITVERSLYCPPEPAPGDSPEPASTPLTFTLERSSPTLERSSPEPGQRMRAEAELSIDESGVVTGVRLTSRSGTGGYDDAFLRHQWQRVFLPATIDGQPVASWLRTGGRAMQL